MPDYGRKRHPGRTFSRPTHSGYADKLFGGEHVASERADALGAVKRTGESFADARDGEQTQVADVAPRIIQTEHFDYEAAAPQVNNNPQEPTEANVYVDPDGLHVLDGSLTVEDANGLVTIEGGVVQSGGIATGSILVSDMMGDLDNLVSNAGFELDGAISGEYPSGWGPAVAFPATAAECSTTTSSPHSGTYALRITAASGAQNSNLAQQDITVLPNKRYRMRAYVRGQAGNNASAAGRFRIHWYDPAGTELSVEITEVAVGTSTTWVELTQVVTAPSTATKASVRLVNKSSVGAAGDKIDFDSVEFYRVDRDMSHASGNVQIDSTGIVITNGYLTFADKFGNNVIGGYGFGAAWLDYISTRGYNTAFQFGTTTNITAATEVSGAATEANYQASLSANIPYWIVASESGSGTLQRTADSAAIGGYALKWSGTETAEVYQDFLVVPGKSYFINLSYKWTVSSAQFTETIAYQFRDSDRAAIGSKTNVSSISHTSSQSTYWTGAVDPSLLGPASAPANSRYMRVYVKFARDSGSPDVYLNQVWLREFDLDTNYILAGNNTTTPSMYVYSDGSINLMPGTNPAGTPNMSLVSSASGSSIVFNNDVYLYRSAADILDVRATDAQKIIFSPGGNPYIHFDKLTTGNSIRFVMNQSHDLLVLRSSTATSGTLAISGNTTDTISSAQNNYAPNNLHSSFLVCVTASGASRNITGLDAGLVNGELKVMMNAGSSNNVVLVHESASSTAANRFRGRGAANVTLAPGEAVMCVYSTNQNRWMVVG